MPKLPKTVAKKAQAAESTSFEPIPEDTYLVELKAVHTTNKDGEVLAGPSGPYWSWELAVVGGEYDTRKLWVNTSLSEAALWKMNETFTAFGYTCDSDTDEIIGDKALAVVTQRVIERGSRKGQLSNNVENLMPADADAGDDDDSF